MKYLYLLVITGLFICCFVPDAFAAAGSGGGLPYESALEKLRLSLTGPFAYVISVIGIVVGFAMLVFGSDLTGFFKTLIGVILTVSVLIGVNAFLANFFGRGAVITVQHILM